VEEQRYIDIGSHVGWALPTKTADLINLKQWIILMNFDIIDKITEIETIARGSGIREYNRLRKVYGGTLGDVHK